MNCSYTIFGEYKCSNIIEHFASCPSNYYSVSTNKCCGNIPGNFTTYDTINKTCIYCPNTTTLTNGTCNSIINTSPISSTTTLAEINNPTNYPNTSSESGCNNRPSNAVWFKGNCFECNIDPTKHLVSKNNSNNDIYCAKCPDGYTVASDAKNCIKCDLPNYTVDVSDVYNNKCVLINKQNPIIYNTTHKT